VNDGGPPRAAIISLAGPDLLAEEALLLERGRPAGIILFARNCIEPAQLRRLTAAIRRAAGDPALPILIDQEGGRVMRLRPPAWRPLPPMRRLGDAAEGDLARGLELARGVARVMAADLAAVGITVDCAPVLDLGLPETTAAIGDRAFSAAPEIVGRLGEAFARALMGGGVAPVMKHLPGHGRARVDSHHALPVVGDRLDTLRTTDFRPFRYCRELPLAMTAHLVYSAVDPHRPGTMSRTVITEIIRHEIGFSGILISDDLGMGALQGPLPERATAVVQAGCDLALYCGGRVEDAAAVLAAVPLLDGARAALWRAAVPPPRTVSEPDPVDVAAVDRLAGTA
jgi:beta-N-acetylhexosaminidase